MRTDAPGQTTIEFALGEAGYAERWARLKAALDRVEADLYLVTFCRMVFEATAGGAKGSPWRRSAAELRRRPDGLCCGETKLYATLRDAQRARLVEVFQHKDGAGLKSRNGYSIDWEGVAWQLASPRTSAESTCATRSTIRAESTCAWRRSIRATRRSICAGTAPLKEDLTFNTLMDEDEDDEEEQERSSSSSSSSVHPSGSAPRADRATDQAAEPPADELAAVRAEANGLLKTLWPPPARPRLSEEQREFILEAVLVAHRHAGPEWLRRAVERTARAGARDPLRYLRTVLAGDVADREAIGDEEGRRMLRELLRDVRREARQLERRLRKPAASEHSSDGG